MKTSNTKIPHLFFLLYFSGFLNSYIEQLYQNETLIKSFREEYFYLIMAIVKIASSSLIGFIIDHVQYSLNFLLITQFLVIVSFSFYLANLFTHGSYDLYFAIGFEILGQQSSQIMILTLITKHFSSQQIPTQIGYFYQFNYLGKLCCFLLNFIETKQYLQQYLAPLFLALLCFITYCIQVSYKLFRKDAYSMFQELSETVVSEESDLLSAIKKQLNNKKILIIIVAGLILSIISIYQQQLLVYFYQHQKSFLKQQSNVQYSFYYSSLTCLFGIIFSYSIYTKLALNKNPQKVSLQNLYDASINSLVCFIISTVVVCNWQGSQLLQLFTYAIISVWQEFNLAAVYISSTFLIGYDKNNYQTQGLTFGVLSMMINIANVGVLAGIVHEQLNKFYILQLSVNAYGFCYCLLGVIFCRIILIQRTTKDINQL